MPLSLGAKYLCARIDCQVGSTTTLFYQRGSSFILLVVVRLQEFMRNTAIVLQ